MATPANTKNNYFSPVIMQTLHNILKIIHGVCLALTLTDYVRWLGTMYTNVLVVD